MTAVLYDRSYADFVFARAEEGPVNDDREVLDCALLLPSAPIQQRHAGREGSPVLFQPRLPGNCTCVVRVSPARIVAGLGEVILPNG